MKIFECDSCGNLLFYENVSCLRCNHTLGFIPELIDLCALEPSTENRWRSLSPRFSASAEYRQCANTTQHGVCNWLITTGDTNPLCESCRLNLVIPDLSINGNLERWRKLEIAKRRVMYSLLRFRLPTEPEGNREPLRFQFMADPPGGQAVLTGHADGVITINIAEADEAERERRRVQLHEPLRTLLGHIRHEVAHYYWDRLVAGTPHLAEFRKLFGDERQNYAAALQSHYQNGPPPDWAATHVTAYAASHPWEDWAETWAHYLHITDSLETAGSFGVSVRPRHPQAATLRAEPRNIDAQSNLEDVIKNWIPLTHFVNELNRGMGLPDLYPFVLSSATARKLAFVHSLLLNG
jgi:hypothetical protein